MKIYKHICGIIASLLLTCSVGVYAEGGQFDWLEDHIVVRTSENVKCDSKGDVLSADVTKRSKLTLSQTTVEKKARNKKGELVVVSSTRVTDTIDTDGCKTSVQEKELVPGSGFEILKITTSEKTSEGQITTIQSKDKSGQLKLVSRTKVVRGEKGGLTTTIESPDKNGQMFVREVRSSY